MIQGLISVIIVNYNGKKWLKACIDSLQNQTYKKFEIIIVDNHSHDDSVRFLKKNYPNITLVQSKENSGFAQGNNLALPFAQGEFVLLINNDTYVEKTFFNDFLMAFEHNKKLAIAQSKLVLTKDTSIIDTCGGFWTDSTFLYHVGNDKNAQIPLYNKPFPVFSVKAASVLIKREVIDQLGLFDQDFWCYYEETDFCHRAWIAGFECIYWPKALTYHAGGGTSLSFPNTFVQFHNFKNKLCSFLKNFELKSLITIIPTYLLINIGLSFAWIMIGKGGHALSLYKAIFWNVSHIRDTLNKRKLVQNKRKKNDSQYLRIVKKNPRAIFFLRLFQLRMDLYEDKI